MRFNTSLCLTPKRCSSSTTTSPRSRKPDVVLKQAVGADQDVDVAVRGRGEDLVLFLRRAEPAEHLDHQGIAGQPARGTC